MKKIGNIIFKKITISFNNIIRFAFSHLFTFKYPVEYCRKTFLPSRNASISPLATFKYVLVLRRPLIEMLTKDGDISRQKWLSRLWIMEQQEVKSNFRTAKVNNCRTASVSNFRTGNWKIRSCTAENMRRCKAANMRSYINISSPSPFLFKSPLSSHLPEIVYSQYKNR